MFPLSTVGRFRRCARPRLWIDRTRPVILSRHFAYRDTWGCVQSSFDPFFFRGELGATLEARTQYRPRVLHFPAQQSSDA